MSDELRHSEEWSGTSPEGLSYQINFWGKGSICDGAGMWNYYVLIPEGQLRAEDWARVWLAPAGTHPRSSGIVQPWYMGHGPLDDADWHGGITFYEKRQPVDGTGRSIKVGCDFGHAFDRDRGYPYDLEWVHREALATCTDLARILRPLARCSYTGMYFDPEFVADVPGYNGIISPAGLGCRSHWDFKERVKKNPELFAEAA